MVESVLLISKFTNPNYPKYAYINNILQKLEYKILDCKRLKVCNILSKSVPMAIRED